MTLEKLINELTDLYAAGVSGDTDVILFAEHTIGSETVAIQMDELLISLNGDCVQLFMRGDL